MSSTGGPSRSGADGGPGDAVLLERDQELESLSACLGAAARGRASLVIVEGPAGVGKTRLIEAALREAQAQGRRVLSAAGRELEREIPGAVARQLLAPMLGAVATQERRLLVRGLEPLVLEGAPPPDRLSGEDPTAAVTMALVALIERLCARADRSPVALVVDDAHWADSVSLRLLAHLALERERFPFALVLALRVGDSQPEALQTLRAVPGARVLRPAPLSAPAVAQVVRLRMPAAEPAFCEVCARASAGNPFLLVELLEALREEGVRGTVVDAGRLEGFVPDSVLSAVLVRLARLPPAAAQLARSASILREAPLRQVAALAGLEPLQADAAADRLATAGFLRAGEPIGFRHPLVASAIYGDQTPFARARAHRRAAEIIAGDGAAVEAIAAHLRLARAEGDQWVVATLRAAARRSLDAGDPAAAAALLERALDEPPAPEERPAVLIALADAQAARGARDSVDRLHQALELIAQPSRRAEALYDLALLLLARHDLTAAAACAERGLVEIEGGSPLADALEGVWLAAAGLTPALRERVAPRVRQLRSDALAGRDPRDPVTLGWLALRLAALGDDRQVVRRLLAAAMAGSADRAAVRAATITFVGAALIYIEDLEPAELELTKAIEQAEREGRVLTRAVAQLWRATGRLRCGALGAARADAEQALSLRHFGWRLHLGPCAAILAEALIEQGDRQGAREALEIGAEADHGPPQPLLLEARARLALENGDPGAAVADLQAAAESLRGMAVDHPAILPWRSQLAHAVARLGDRDRALGLALEEAELARQLGTERARGVALAVAGTIARGDRGLELLEQAAATLARTPAQLEHARALLELGATLRRTRHRAAAREPLRLALERATALGATPLAERARHELAATGARPRRVALDGVDSLTPTERRIASLAAEGLSNRDIAGKLVVTTKTVEWHLGRIYGKLGVSGRRELDSERLQAARPAPLAQEKAGKEHGRSP